MIFYKQCPICQSSNLQGYAIDCLRKGPHMSRVICGDCRMVFANPMADATELMAFYAGYYHKGNMQQLNYTDAVSGKIEEVKQLGYDKVAKQAAYIYQYKTGGRFLDVGCGLGIGLLYVNRPEFELYATEYDAVALDFVQANFQNIQTFQGELADAKYPDEHFDYIYCNHVIEHVLDPVAYFREMYRVLKKDGILYIGTPNRGSNLYRLYRAYRFAGFRVPQIIDGIEHTFVFSRQNLADMAKRQGFKVKRHRAIPLGDSFTNIFRSDLSIRKKLSRYVQTFFTVNQELICSK